MPELSTHSAREEIDRLNRRIERLRTALDKTEQTRDAMLKTVEYFSENNVKPRRRRVQININIEELRGKRIEEALIYIAERSGGEVRSGHVRPLLADAGILRGTQISHALSSALRMSDRFESVSRGLYRLIGELEEKEDGDTALSF